jgi:hypothetical protein
LIEGLRSNNSKTLCEIINIIIDVLKLNKEAVPTKDIREIARFIDSKDRDLKNNALNYLMQE